MRAAVAGRRHGHRGRATPAAHAARVPRDGRAAADRARGGPAPRPERRPAPARRHARAGGRPARGLLEARGRRRLHALADLLTGRDRGIRGSGRAGAPAAGSVPAGLPRRHPARPPPAGRLAPPDVHGELPASHTGAPERVAMWRLVPTCC